MSDTHSLARTSPKGGTFVGRCVKCGKTDLTTKQMFEPCANPAGQTREQSLVAAITGKQDQ